MHKDTRHIPKDYFINKKQKINHIYQERDHKKWISLRKEVENEIDGYLTLKMVRRAQQLELKVGKGDDAKLVTSITEIGKAFKNDGSIATATKINSILNEDFKIRSGYEYYGEGIIMKNLNIKYSDQDENNDKSSIARMIVNRKCNIAKVMSKRVKSTHQNMIIKKRTPTEVKSGPERSANQSFALGKSGWFTKEGKQFKYDDNSPKK